MSLFGRKLNWYNWVAKPYPGPGSGNYVFVPGFTLPTFPAIGGPGKVVMGQIRPLEGNHAYYANKNIPMAGLGGLQHGQIAGQGLLVPPGQ